MKPLLLAVLVACLYSSSVFANKTTSSKPTYPATEEAASSEVVDSAPGSSRINAATESKSPVQSNQFDIVPTSQAEAMIRRLRVAEALITRYGRAYDYRAMTVPQLQAILDGLNAESQKQNQSRVELREREEQVIRAQAAQTAESPAAIEASHDSIGAEAPEPSAPASM
jgi:hypothetical protein